MDYLTISQAAELAGIKRSTMGYHCQRGLVKTVEIGGRKLIERPEAERFAGIARRPGRKPKAAEAAA